MRHDQISRGCGTDLEALASKNSSTCRVRAYAKTLRRLAGTSTTGWARGCFNAMDQKSPFPCELRALGKRAVDASQRRSAGGRGGRKPKRGEDKRPDTIRRRDALSSPMRRQRYATDGKLSRTTGRSATLRIVETAWLPVAVRKTMARSVSLKNPVLDRENNDRGRPAIAVSARHQRDAGRGSAAWFGQPGATGRIVAPAVCDRTCRPMRVSRWRLRVYGYWNSILAPPAGYRNR